MTRIMSRFGNPVKRVQEISGDFFDRMNRMCFRNSLVDKIPEGLGGELYSPLFQNSNIPLLHASMSLAEGKSFSTGSPQ
jgi:hypothetical protein